MIMFGYFLSEKKLKFPCSPVNVGAIFVKILLNPILHSERQILYAILAFLSAIGLNT